MEYHRSPFREKQSNYEMTMTPKRTAYRNEQISYNDKQNPQRSQLSINRKVQSAYRNTFLEGNPKHITSQMINEYENQFPEKTQRSYKRQAKYEGEIDSQSKSTFEEHKKYSAKNMEIESKINKMQSFHQKIESLLDMVNKKPKTPSKTSEFSHPLTPQKGYGQQPSSRSTAKVSPLNLKSKLGMQAVNKQGFSRQVKQGRQVREIRETRENRETRQHKYGDQVQSNYYQKNSQQHFEQISSNEINTFDRNNNARITSKFNDGKMLHRVEIQIPRENKYFAKENRGPLARGQEQFKESHRKKSKEYMKSIEGQVRDIQNTIQLLNAKIKQVDNISSFKKQVAFDNLSTSNPESLSDNQERVASEIQKMRTPARTPTRSYKQSVPRNSPPGNYTRYGEGESRDGNSSYKNDRVFRKTSTNGMITPSKYELQLSTLSYNSDERNGYKNEGLKTMNNPYDGDVEQSQERNRFTLMQEIRMKRN